MKKEMAERRKKTSWRLLSSTGREYELNETDRAVIGRYDSDVMIPVGWRSSLRIR